MDRSWWWAWDGEEGRFRFYGLSYSIAPKEKYGTKKEAVAAAARWGRAEVRKIMRAIYEAECNVGHMTTCDSKPAAQVGDCIRVVHRNGRDHL